MENAKGKNIKKRHIRKNTIILASLMLCVIVLNVMARTVPGFADWHIRYVFPIWQNSYGRFTSLFPFSVGEWLLGLGFILSVVFLIALVLMLVKPVRRFAGKYIRVYGNIVVIVALIMTENCFILYQGTTFAEKYGINQECITGENLIKVRNYIVHKANEMALSFERDEDGNILYNGDYASQAIKEMKRVGEIYPQLSGFYVTPKWIYHSAFLSQQYILGYYFPFSMEANLNSYQYPTNVPTTMCHELAHTKGFILEDEANYIGFLGCVDSKDPYFEYAAYLSVLYYVESAYQKTITGHEDAYTDSEKISELVLSDDIFLTKESWDIVNEKSWFSTETVDKATDVFLDTNLKVNGVSDGRVSYSRVVKLLLTYYDGKLY